MKKITFVLIVISSLAFTAGAQEVRINTYANYAFDDSFDSYYNINSFFNGKIEGGLQWGTGLEYKASDHYGIEILYLRQDTNVPINYYDSGPVSRTLETNINYIMLGGLRYAGNDIVEGYGGLLFGAAIFNNEKPTRNEPSTATRLAWGARLGANVWASERVGLKIQATIVSAVQSVGGSFYVGSGGSGAAVSTYSTLLQFTIGGGLVFKVRD